MVAFNFKRQFVKHIRTGRKTHTIRTRESKRKLPKAGDRIRIYCGQRTKYCFKVIPDPDCTLLTPIHIHVMQTCIDRIEIGGVRVPDLQQFARSDGFVGIKAMHDFWLKTYGNGTYGGVMVGWDRQFADYERMQAALIELDGETVAASLRMFVNEPPSAIPKLHVDDYHVYHQCNSLAAAAQFASSSGK